MKRYHDSCAFSFDIVDKQTEDAYTMMGQQESKAGCIREMFFGFCQCKRDYQRISNGIPKRERLKKFLGLLISERLQMRRSLTPKRRRINAVASLTSMLLTD